MLLDGILKMIKMANFMSCTFYHTYTHANDISPPPFFFSEDLIDKYRNGAAVGQCIYIYQLSLSTFCVYLKAYLVTSLINFSIHSEITLAYFY